jgi:hypothetical protein
MRNQPSSWLEVALPKVPVLYMPQLSCEVPVEDVVPTY